VNIRKTQGTIKMKKSFTKLSTTQNEFLEQYLRGTGRALSSWQAETRFGIMNIRARISELRGVGLKVRKLTDHSGCTAYSISARDVTGSRAKIFNNSIC